MRILALDTALEACAVAIVEDERVLASETEPMLRGHAEALIPMVERVAARGGGLEGLDRIVVTVGPGSFTGLRVAISAARGFALALRVPCVGVSTLAALAEPFLSEEDGRPVAAVIDARHSNLYFALMGPRGPLVEARVINARDAARMLGSGARLAGPGVSVLAREAAALGMSYSIADAGPSADIIAIARLGAQAEVDINPPKPLYLRAADVTPQTGGQVPRA